MRGMGLRNTLRVLMRRLFPPMFTVRIEGGGTRAVQGTVTSAFLEDCQDIVRRRGIESGWIWGHRMERGVRLEFSSGIVPGDRQRFRNTAGVHRL